MFCYSKRLFYVVTLFICVNIFAQNIGRKSFKVKGNCTMCKERIETVARKMGAIEPVWEAKTQTLVFNIDSEKISSDSILKEIYGH